MEGPRYCNIPRFHTHTEIFCDTRNQYLNANYSTPTLGSKSPAISYVSPTFGYKSPASPRSLAASAFVDCRSLPKTSDLVAIFEKNIQEYQVRRSPRRRKEIASREESERIPRNESFTLKQRQRIKSPPHNWSNSGGCYEYPSPRLRPKNFERQESYNETKRTSCGLRVACHSAKPALLSGLNSTTSENYSSIYSTPSFQNSSFSSTGSWRDQLFANKQDDSLLSTSTTNNSPDFSKLARLKVQPMAPVTVVTTASSNTYMQNKGSIRACTTPGSPISANDSGAETMTSMNSVVTSCSSTPTKLHERFVCSDYPPEPSTESTPSQIYQTTVNRAYKARIPLNATTERLPHRGEGDIPSVSKRNTSFHSAANALRTPTSVIRKTRLSGLNKFCGLSRNPLSKSKDKMRDPYIPSPSQIPTTPEVTHYKVFKPKHQPINLKPNLGSDEQIAAVQNGDLKLARPSSLIPPEPKTTSAKIAVASTPQRSVNKTMMGTAMLTSNRNSHQEEMKASPTKEVSPDKNWDKQKVQHEEPDAANVKLCSLSNTLKSQEGKKSMLAFTGRKAFSFTSDEELSVGTTVDDDCELASIPDSVSSRGHRELHR